MNNIIENILNELSEKDKDMIKNLSTHLYDILCDELHAGNAIVEINWWDGDIIFLEKPFLTPIRADIEGVMKYLEIDDPHYWKAEYRDWSRYKGATLACKFGGIRSKKQNELHRTFSKNT